MGHLNGFSVYLQKFLGISVYFFLNEKKMFAKPFRESIFVCLKAKHGDAQGSLLAFLKDCVQS